MDEANERFDAVLVSIWDWERKISVIKQVREITGLGLAEAKHLIEHLPRTLKEDVKEEEGRAIKSRFDELGAHLELRPLALAGPAAARDAGNEVLHTPWLAIRLVQDGRPVRLVRLDMRTTEARLAPRPFQILFPKGDPEIAYQLCAWTDDSIFNQMVSRSTHADPNAGGEHPCFLPGTGMADTEAGRGALMLSDEGHNYLIDLRLGPDPDHPSVFYSELSSRPGGDVPIAEARGPIYVVAFHDADRDGYLGNSEHDHLVLTFGKR